MANGTNDLVNQAVFDMARSIDPTGERSVGVITKCDVTQHPIELVRWAQNEEMYLAHGWFVVRNRTPKEAETGITSDDRLRKEKDFLEAEPWVDLPASRRGTEALKRYLAQLLCNRIQDNFPAMLTTVRTRKAMVLDELNAIAGPRTTVEEKRTYLSEIAHDFNSQSSDALRGRYEALRSDDWKIRRLVRQLNEEFALRVIANGHYLPFAEIPQPKTYSNIPAQEHLAAVAGSSFPASSDAPSGFVFKDTSASAKPDKQEVSLHDSASVIPAIAVLPSLDYVFGTDIREKSDGIPLRMHSFRACPTMPDYSFEELRLKDFEIQAAKSSTLFGSPTPATQAAKSSSLFSSFAPSGSPFAGSTSVGGDAPSGILGGGTSSGSDTFSTGFGGFGSGVSREGGPSTKGQDSLRAEDQKPPADKKTAKKPLFDFSNDVSNSNNPKSSLPPKPSSNRHSAQSKASDLIYGWIRRQVMSCRGTELQGTINPDILPILFREQSRNWGGIAKNHFTDLAVQVESICISILEETCEEENVRRKIRAKILAANKECMERGEASLARRITELQNRHLQTHNPDFERKVAEAKRLRFCTALERYRTSSALNMVFEKETQMRESLVVVDLSDTDSLFKELHMSNARNLENEIHDTLKAYYEIERANFIENVTQLIVETYLNDPEGPVLRFSPVYVSRLSDQEIQELAAEDEAIIQTRKEKEATLSRLKQAEAIAKKWA